CICCTLRDDLLAEVTRLAEEKRFDYLLIESTGISEPMPVATTFDFRDENGVSLADVSRLDTMVTVVDVVNLLKDFDSTDFLADRGEHLGDEDDRTLVDLLVDQIEFADVIILNKLDLATEEEVDSALKIIASLNPSAKLIQTTKSQVPLKEVLDTGLFDLEKAQEHPLWFKELYGFADHTPETEEYGIGSFVYRARRPFDPQRFFDFLQEERRDVIRAKGLFWLATRDAFVGDLSWAGSVVRHEPMGYWWAAVPKNRWPQDEGWKKTIAQYWDPTYGDRRQELVFIGANLDQAAITAALDACLVGEEDALSFDPEEHAHLKDPFPVWDFGMQVA
ncbi:MAG: GTP-binding protein, partial [Pseudomonadota bacterium]